MDDDVEFKKASAILQGSATGRATCECRLACL
jgi:hypothetical protein